MIEESIATHLTGTAGVSTLIQARIYPSKVPADKPYPLVRILRQSGPRTHTIGGPAGMAMGRWDIEALGATYMSAKAVAVQIRLAIDGYDLSRGLMGASGYQTEVHSIAIQDEEDDYDYELLKFIVRSSYDIWYSEATS